MRDSATFPTASRQSANGETTFWTWPRIVLAGFLALVVMALGVGVGVYASWKNSDLIAPGIYVQGESLGNLTRLEARQRLEERFGRMFVTVQTPDRDFKLSLNQLGGEILFSDAVNNAYWYGRNGNIASGSFRYWTSQKTEQRRALPVKWNKDQLRKTMWTVATQYLRPARNARLEVTSAGVQIVPDQSGRAINVGETCAALQTQYYVGKPEIKATTTSVAPKLAAADLIGRDVLMGKYTTSFNPGEEGRTTNVRLATTAINGKVLMPGEKFSFNAMTGERTMDKGYRVAHIFVHLPGKEKAEVVDGRGGGVCQVSSTLFNAVRKTNDKTDDHLAIVERNTHSLPVSYVPSGLDATVAWPDKDFRFRNTFPHPVYLRAEVSGSRLSISIWGRVLADTNSVTASADSETSESKTTKTSADSPT